MPVFNWIQARFTDGPNFVSDATTETSRAIAQALGRLPIGRAGCEFGRISLASGEGTLPCSYLRCANQAGGVLYTHAVLAPPGSQELTLAGVQRLFETRYGTPAEKRVQELVTRLEMLPVSQATLPLTDLFVEAAALERQSASAVAPRRGPQLPWASVSPWLLAAAAAAIAGFFAGPSLVEPPPPVSAPPPPGLDLEERLARLEASVEARLEDSKGAAGIPIRAQLTLARQLHESELAVKNAEIRELNERLEAALADTRAAAARNTASPAPEPPAAPVAPRRATVMASLLSVRAGPGAGYHRLSRLVRGTVVELAGEPEAGWIQIGLPEAGFVSTDFLDFSRPAPPPPRNRELWREEGPAASLPR